MHAPSPSNFQPWNGHVQQVAVDGAAVREVRAEVRAERVLEVERAGEVAPEDELAVPVLDRGHLAGREVVGERDLVPAEGDREREPTGGHGADFRTRFNNRPGEPRPGTQQPVQCPPMDTVRIGILGAARIAPNAIIRPARNVDEAIVGAVAARDRSKADRFAAKHDVPKVRDSYAALVDDPDLDAIYNPLPNGLHAEWTIAALEAGKHVLCEKPFTANAKEAEAVAAVAARTGRVVMEAFHYRYHPLAAAHEGDRRERRARAAPERRGVVVRPAPEAERHPVSTTLAGGATMDVGTYTVHIARLLAGSEPEVVSAEARLRTPDVDRAMRAEFQFPNGVTGRITCSMMSARVIQTYARVDRRAR